MIGLAMMLAQVTNPDADLRGTVGVCVRWKAPDHVSDAVVVVSSGNPKLDAAAPASIKAMEWTRPKSYNGEWIGVSLSFAGDTSNQPLPQCEKYPLPKP